MTILSQSISGKDNAPWSTPNRSAQPWPFSFPGVTAPKILKTRKLRDPHSSFRLKTDHPCPDLSSFPILLNPLVVTLKGDAPGGRIYENSSGFVPVPTQHPLNSPLIPSDELLLSPLQPSGAPFSSLGSYNPTGCLQQDKKGCSGHALQRFL